MNRINGAISCLIVCLVFFIYGQTAFFEFINYDDQDYVTENSNIQHGISLEGIKWAFSFVENDLTYWHPLAYIAHMVDCQLFGTHPGLHHLSNATLHALNAVLLYFLCLYMTGARFQSAFAACLFAVHPVCVDSVAWISQKKTLLAAFFWLMTVFVYVRYARMISVKRYLAVCFFTAAGLMTKPVLVTIPIVLLVLDIWPLNRLEGFESSRGLHQEEVGSSRSLRWLVLEKIPLLFLVFLWGITPFIPEHVTAKNISFEIVPFGLRLKNALVSYVSYLENFVCPVDLAFLYPYPDHVSLFSALAAAVVLGILTLVLLQRFRTHPYLLAGWFVFTISLVPFLGFVQGAVWPAYADRFAYVPFIGLYVGGSWGFKEMATRFEIEKRAVTLAAVLMISVLAFLAFIQTGVWKDNIHLYTHALKVTKGNYLAHNNLGIAYDEKGYFEEAQRQYQASLSVKPGFSKAHHNLAIHLLKRGERKKAAEHFKMSLLSNPDNPVAKYNLAAIAMADGKMEEAESLYMEAISDRPDFSDAYNNLGVLLSRKGNKERALEHFKKAVIHNPENIGALSNLGNELFDMGRFYDALKCFTKALGMDPMNVQVLNDMGVLYGALGMMSKAEESFKKVLALEPGNKMAHDNLNLITQRKKDLESDLEKARKDSESKPGDVKKQVNYAFLASQTGDYKTAESVYLSALTLSPDSLEALAGISQLYEKSGQYDKAIVYYTRLSESHRGRRGEAYYLIASMHAMMNQSDDAVRWLQSAADSGFSAWAYVQTDYRFDGIRKTKKFKDFMSLVPESRP